MIKSTPLKKTRTPIIVKKTIFPRKDIWYTTDWQDYCSYVGDLHLVELRNILKEAFLRKPSIEKMFSNFSKIPYSKASKRTICSFISVYTPEKIAHNCHNPTTLEGDDFGDFEKEEVVYWNEGKNKYCFTVDEIEKLDANPYTKTKFVEKTNLLKGKRKPVQPWDTELKMRYEPESDVSEYKYKKAIISQQIAEADLIPIPFDKLEKMVKNQLIKMFKQYIPDVDTYKDRLSMLTYIYSKLVTPILNTRMNSLFHDDGDTHSESTSDEEVFDSDDEDLLWESLGHDGWALSRVSARLRDNERVVREAVSNFGEALEYASTRLRDNENIVREAVRQDGYALAYASIRLRDNEDIVREAVREDGEALAYASSRLQDNEAIVTEAVHNYGRSLQYASRRLKDSTKIVKIAVNKDSKALVFASRRLRDSSDIVKYAVSKNGGSLNGASKRLQNDVRIVKEAVQQNGEALEFASPRLQDIIDIVKIAVHQNGTALEFASPRLKDTKDIVRIAVHQNGTALEFASPRFQDTKDIVKIAVQQNWRALKFASHRYRSTKAIVREAIRQNGEALKFASNTMKDDTNLVREAINSDVYFLRYASPRLQILLQT